MTKKEVEAANLLIALTVRDIYPNFIKEEQVFNVWTSEYRSTLKFDRDVSALDVACSALKIRYDYGNIVKKDTYLKVLAKCIRIGDKANIVDFFNSIKDLDMVTNVDESLIYSNKYNVPLGSSDEFNSAAEALFLTSVEQNPDYWNLPKIATKKLRFIQFLQITQVVIILLFASELLQSTCKGEWVGSIYWLVLSILNIRLLYDTNRQYVEEKLKCRRIRCK